MKHKEVKVIAVALAMVLCVGCAGMMPKPVTNAQKLAVVEAQFAGFVNAASDMVEAGTMPVKLADKLKPIFTNTALLLDTAHEALGDTLDFNSIMVKLNRLLLQISTEVNK